MRRSLALAVLTLVVGGSMPARALHQESPGALRLTSGTPHQGSNGRSWGNFVAFTSTEDLAGVGAARLPGPQVFVFNLDYYDCAHGTTFPATPCPPSGTPYLIQATNGVGAPANPSVSQPPSGSTTPFDVWIAFDALGSYAGDVGAPASRRQVFLKQLVTNEIRQVTSAGDGDSMRPSLSSIAGIVTFESTAMLAGFPNLAGVPQVYVYERTTNVTRQLSLTPGPGSAVGLGPSTNAMPNEGGSGIAFESTADLVGMGADSGITQIFWADYDTKTHVSTLRQVTSGNAPSRNPFAGNAPKVVVFESDATNLPGTAGLPGHNLYKVAITDPPAPLVQQLTTHSLFGDCAAPALDDSGTRLLFVCEGDPLQNLTVGDRLFAFDDTTSTLYQLTGLGTVTGRPAGNIGQWFATVATSSDLTGSGSCTTQIHVVDYFAGHWDAATSLGQYPEDVAETNACGGNCTTAADCDDGNPCNGTETCGASGVCAHGVPVVCSDGNVCNGVETCNPATGTCVGGLPLSCNDGNPCTDDSCNPVTGCVATPNALPCDDGNPCTVGDVCANATCTGTALPCPTCERCDPGTGTCGPGPRSGCAAGTGVRAGLRLRKAPLASTNLLAWKWRRTAPPPSTFGDPLTVDDYALCVFDGADALLLRTDAPAASGCGATTCWTAKAGGSFVYRDPTGSPTGLARLLLKTKPTGATKLSAKAKGTNLAMPPLTPLALPVRTQLHADTGACWEAVFGATAIQRHDATQLKAKLP